jgi:hypothetical protein
LVLFPSHELECGGVKIRGYSCVELLEAASDAFDNLLILGGIVLNCFFEKLLVCFLLEIGKLIALEW